MEVLEVNYLGNLRTEATHLPSGSKIYTDAPKDNHGQGAYFSPTDLVATAVASCGMTIVGILAERKNWNLTQVKAKVEKHMRAQPRSIEKVVVKYQIAGLEKAEDQNMLKHAVRTCPVELTLLGNVEIVHEFEFL
jgi:putative redox protein